MTSVITEFTKNNGIKVKVKDFKSNAKGLMKYDKGGFKIGISSRLNEAEKEYTIAHELAHIYLHYDKGNTIESPLHAQYEEQADRAAKMLLDFIRYVRNAS